MKCEGACGHPDFYGEYDGHDGEVVEVEVSGFGQGSLTFQYCEVAVAHDRANGFTVEATA